MSIKATPENTAAVIALCREYQSFKNAHKEKDLTISSLSVFYKAAMDYLEDIDAIEYRKLGEVHMNTEFHSNFNENVGLWNQYFVSALDSAMHLIAAAYGIGTHCEQCLKRDLCHDLDYMIQSSEHERKEPYTNMFKWCGCVQFEEGDDNARRNARYYEITDIIWGLDRDEICDALLDKDREEIANILDIPVHACQNMYEREILEWLNIRLKENRGGLIAMIFDLPDHVIVPVSEIDEYEEIADYLSDEYEYLVESYTPQIINALKEVVDEDPDA